MGRAADRVDKAEFAFQVVFIGFFVVMFTLYLLYAFLSVLGRFFYRPGKDAGRAVLQAGKDGVDLIDGAVLPVPVAAAISAAVYLYLQGSEENVTGFRITSIRKSDSSNKSSWAAAGRKARLESRSELEELRRKR